MKTSKQLLLCLVAFSLVITSCQKSIDTNTQNTIQANNEQKDNLLKCNNYLLSKVTGSISSEDPNFFPVLFNLYYTYSWNSDPTFFGPNSGNFQTNFSYNNLRNPFGYKHVLQDSFLNKGNYFFHYNGLFPDKVTDNSIPGLDLGYWKLYHNAFKQVDKTGLAFSATTDPVRFEYYTRDFLGQIKSSVYGRALDTPYMKVLYQYNWRGNIAGFDVYVAKDQIPGNNLTTGPEENKQINGYAPNNLNAEALQKKRAFANNKNQALKANNTSYAVAAGIDTSVYYFLSFCNYQHR